MAAGETQLTDLPGRAVTGLGADQDGLTRPAGTRPTGRATAVLRCRRTANERTAQDQRAGGDHDDNRTGKERTHP